MSPFSLQPSQKKTGATGCRSGALAKAQRAFESWRGVNRTSRGSGRFCQASPGGESPTTLDSGLEVVTKCTPELPLSQVGTTTNSFVIHFRALSKIILIITIKTNCRVCFSPAPKTSRRTCRPQGDTLVVHPIDKRVLDLQIPTCI